MNDAVATSYDYRPSASVIIAVKSSATTSDLFDDYDYKLLLFKRTIQTAYAPDHCVFPGGCFEVAADESMNWLSYFKEFGITEAKLQELIISEPLSARPSPLLTNGVNFSRDISLRITAIRETFEEVGILLCRDRETLGINSNGCALYRENFDRVYWQELVHNDASQFLMLCKELKVVPDLWSLYEWSVWRSPTTATKKFDTVFYFVALEQQPSLLLERGEVLEELWQTPVKFLDYFEKRMIWLPPIQYYELSRLTNMSNWWQLLQFTIQRCRKGSTLLMPLYYRCNEGLIGTLSGDDFYHEQPLLFKETIVLDTSLEVFQKFTKCLHRILVLDMYDLKIELSIPPIDSHLSPIRKKLVQNKL